MGFVLRVAVSPFRLHGLRSPHFGAVPIPSFSLCSFFWEGLSNISVISNEWTLNHKETGSILISCAPYGWKTPQGHRPDHPGKDVSVYRLRAFDHLPDRLQGQGLIPSSGFYLRNSLGNNAGPKENTPQPGPDWKSDLDPQTSTGQKCR